MYDSVKTKKVKESDVCHDGQTITSYHLENEGTAKRKKIRPKADTVDIQRIYPENDDLTRSKIITFYINTGNFAVRFLENCLLFTIVPQISNPLYQSATSGVSDVDKNRKWDNMTPFELNNKSLPRGYFFNPITGGPACLINEVEVLLDGQMLQVDRRGFLSVTNTLNKLFLPQDDRQKIVGHPHILHNSKEKLTYGFDEEAIKNLPDYQSSSFKYALNQFNCLNKTGDNQVVLAGDLDGIFPISKPKNLSLEKIYHCSSGLNQKPLIPPHTELTIRIRLNDPLHLRVIDTKCEDNIYFSNTDIGNNSFPFDDLNIHIKDISLLVERIKWDNEKIQKQLSTGGVNYEFDQYTHRAHALPTGQVVTNTKEKIPSHTGLVYIAFMKSCQLYKDSAEKRSSDGTRFALPPNLEKLIFKLNGKTILFENGLHISRDKCHGEPDAMLFYQYLRSRGLTTDSFESFFPDGTNNLGWKCVFPLDLTTFQITEPADLVVEAHWKSTASPADYFLAMFMPESVNINKPTPSSIWKSTANMS